MAVLNETLTGVTYDNLMGGPEVTALTKNISIAAAVKRGQLLSKSDSGNDYIATATGKTAAFVAAEDVDYTDTAIVATVYARGLFNREAIFVTDGDTVAAHEEELRDVGIYLTSIKD